MCASPLSPRHAQPDWMGGGLVSRQMMHAPPSAAISPFLESSRRGEPQFGSRGPSQWPRETNGLPARCLATGGMESSFASRRGAGAVAGPRMGSPVWVRESIAARKNCLAARCIATGGMESSFAGLGAARGWRLSGRFMASACAKMLIVAACLVFRKRTRQTAALVSGAIAMGYGSRCSHCSRCSRCGGRVEPSRSHYQEDGVSIVGEANLGGSASVGEGDCLGPRSRLSVEGESTSGSCSTSPNNHIGLSVVQVRMACPGCLTLSH